VPIIVTQVVEFHDVAQEFLTVLDSMAPMYVNEEVEEKIADLTGWAFVLIRFQQDFMNQLLEAVDTFADGDEIFGKAYHQSKSLQLDTTSDDYIYFRDLFSLLKHDEK